MEQRIQQVEVESDNTILMELICHGYAEENKIMVSCLIHALVIGIEGLNFNIFIWKIIKLQMACLMLLWGLKKILFAKVIYIFI